MSVVTRGVKNAFRNWLRTGAVVLILAIGIGLSLSMLVANEAVTAKINDLKSQVGTTLTVNPAGGRGSEGGGEPLTTAQVETISKLEHVSNVAAVSQFILQNQDSSSGNFAMRLGGDEAKESGKTNLKSAIEPGTLGRRGASANAEVPANFSLPINGVGSQGTSQDGKTLTITAGRTITKNDSDDVAVVGTALAAKNNLSVGSTFTAFSKTFTVVGIFDQGNQFENAGLVIPLSVAQALNGTNGEVSSIVVTVDSVENLESVQSTIKSSLGSDKVDVTSTQENAQTAIDSLKGVQQISIIAFVGALVAAAVIIFLIMLMIVRERRREIGVLKAIGGSNRTIVTQFIVESLVLVVLGTVVGLGVALVSSSGIANALVTSSAQNSAQSTNTASSETAGPRGGGRFQLRQGGSNLQSATSLVGQVAANVGWMTVMYGFLAAIVIAVVGSAIPAWLIAKVRPAEVLRGE